MEEQRAFFQQLLAQAETGFKGKSNVPSLSLENLPSTDRQEVSNQSLECKKPQLQLPSRNQCEGDETFDDEYDSDQSSDSEEDILDKAEPELNMFGFAAGESEQIIESARFGNQHLGQDGHQKCEFCSEKWHPLSSCPVYFVHKHKAMMENLRQERERVQRRQQRRTSRYAVKS